MQDITAFDFHQHGHRGLVRAGNLLQRAVQVGIERLPQELRDLLSVASALGKTFDARDLETAYRDKGYAAARVVENAAAAERRA